MQNSLEYIDNLFNNKLTFEKEVLNVSSDKDRAEVIHILLTKMLEDTLKEHINFLYIEKFEDFTCKPIVNLIFRDVANEWIDFAIEELKLSKDEALNILKDEKKILFLKKLAKDYYTLFKSYIFEKIVDTFLYLLVKNAVSDKKSLLINAVINSDYIPNRTFIGVNSSDQLSESIKEAQKLKEEKVMDLLHKLEIMRNKIESPKTPLAKKESLCVIYPNYEKKLLELQSAKLETFSEVLKRLKRTFIQTLKNKE